MARRHAANAPALDVTILIDAPAEIVLRAFFDAAEAVNDIETPRSA